MPDIVRLSDKKVDLSNLKWNPQDQSVILGSNF